MAGGPGGTEVGRVSVRVVPDTSKFANELRAQLKRIEKEIRGSIEIGSDFDALGLRAKVKAAADAARGTVKVDADVDSSALKKTLALDLAKLRDTEIKVPVRPYDDNLWKKLQAIVHTASTQDTIKIPVEMVRGVQEKIVSEAKAVKAAAEAATGPIEIPAKVKPDLDLFQQRLLAEVKSVEKQAEARIPITIKGEMFRARLKAAVAAAEAGIKADIPVDFHTATAARARLMAQVAALKQMTKLGDDGSADKLAGSLKRAGDNANGASRSFMGLTRTSWLVVGVLSIAEPILGLVAGLLASLPSLMAAGGLAAGAIVLGLDGIKKAASTLKPDLEALKKSVSDTFQTRLTPQFEQLRTLFPMLTTGFNGIANGLSDMSQGFVNVVTSASGMSRLNTIFENTHSLLSGLTPSVENVTNSFLTLGAKGSEHFGELSGALNKFTGDFNNMINELSNNGSLDKMFVGLKDTFNGLSDLFNSLFENGVKAMGDLGPQLGKSLTSLGTLVDGLSPILTSFSNNLLKVIESLGNTLGPTLEKLSPGLNMLMDTMGTGMAEAINALSPALQALADLLSGALKAGIEAIQPMLPQLKEAFSQIGTALSQLFSDPAMKQAMTDFATTVVPQLAQAFIQLAPIIADVVHMLLPMVSGFIEMQSVILGGVLGALNALLGVLGNVTGFFSSLQDKVKELSVVFGAAMPEIGNIVSTGWELVKQKTAEAFQALVEAVARGIADVLAGIAKLPGQIPGALGDTSGILRAAGEALMDGLLSGIVSGFQKVLSFASSIASKIAAVKGPLPYDKRVLIPNGQALMDGLNSGLQDGFQDVLGNVQGMAGQMADAFTSRNGEVAAGARSMMKSVNSAVSGQKELAYVAKKVQDQNPKPQTKKLSEETKARVAALKAQAQQLELQAKEATAASHQTEDKEEKKRLQAQAEQLRIQADRLKMQAQEIQNTELYGNKLGELNSETDKTSDEMETQGLSIMEKLQRGLNKGWSNISKDLRDMVNELGDAFGIENIGDKFDKAMTDSKLATMPQDFAGAVGNQFLQDLGVQGNGFLPELVSQVTQYHYHISDFEKAQQDERNRKKRESLQWD